MSTTRPKGSLPWGLAKRPVGRPRTSAVRELARQEKAVRWTKVADGLARAEEVLALLRAGYASNTSGRDLASLQAAKRFVQALATESLKRKLERR